MSGCDYVDPPDDTPTPIVIAPADDDFEGEKLSASLIMQLRKSKKVHDKFAEQFKNKYRISGKIMSEWKEYFRVALPPDLNPRTAQQLDAKFIELHQEASFYKAEAEARLTAYSHANNERYRDQFAALVAEYKVKGEKLPAKDTLVALSEHAIADTKDGEVHAEIECNFWAEILKDLANSRKLLENAVLSLSVEMKALGYEKYLDKLGNNFNKGE